MPSTRRRVKFGNCEFDQSTGELWTDGARLVLSKQLFRILAVLVEQPGMLVTRDELQRELWPEDTFVDFEHSINAAVRRLRDAIGDSAIAPRFIETIPQRGYRFIGLIEEVSASASTEDSALRGGRVEVTQPRADSVQASDPPGRWLLAATIPLALLAVLVIFYEMRARRAPQTDAHRRALVRLVSTSGLNTDPAISYDGNLLAYASDRRGAGDLDLYVQPIAGGEAVRVTSDSANDAEPSFSPDGAKIVFSRRGAGLYVVGALGGEPRLIVPAAWPRTPRFSPDGTLISYWTGFPLSVAMGGSPGALGSMFVVPVAGGSPRPIETHLANARYPVWSPDGQSILFVGEDKAGPATSDWYVVPPHGGKAKKTGAVDALRAAGVAKAVPIPGAWTSRRDAVVFATNEGDRSNVWQIGISPQTGRVSGAPERLTFGTGMERSPVMASSSRIVFASVVENVDVWRVPLHARTGVATGPLERLTDDAASDRLRSVSSDGQKIFFISSRTKRDEVWMRDLQTGRELQLTHAGADEASASPDGSQVAFSRSERGLHRIEVVRTADGLESKLCDGCDAPASWSRDGKRLLYRVSGPSRVFLHDFLSGGNTGLLSHPSWILDRPRFSPDGEWVTFHTASSPTVRQIYSARLGAGREAGEEAWVPVVTDHGCHPTWSPEGRLLYYFSFRDGSFCPWVQQVDPASGRPIDAARAVQHFHAPRLRAATGAAAFNDVQAGYLYLTLTEATGNIWMIDADKN